MAMIEEMSEGFDRLIFNKKNGTDFYVFPSLFVGFFGSRSGEEVIRGGVSLVI